MKKSTPNPLTEIRRYLEVYKTEQAQAKYLSQKAKINEMTAKIKNSTAKFVGTITNALTEVTKHVKVYKVDLENSKKSSNVFAEKHAYAAAINILFEQQNPVTKEVIQVTTSDGFRMGFSKRYLVITLVVLTTIYYISHIGPYQSNADLDPYLLSNDEILSKDSQVVKNWRHLSDNETRSLSTLGKILYLNDNPPLIQKTDKIYKILVWKYGTKIERRHLYHFGKTRQNPFQDCSVQNCIVTYKDADLDTADIVLIHLHRTTGVDDLPPSQNRKSSQIWSFLTDESPYHTFLEPQVTLKDFNGIFNWSMTYKMNSDIPVPYGRAVIRNSTEKFPISKEFTTWIKSKRKDVLVAIMGSNCGSKNHRWQYVKELKKHITVDAYGGCGTLKCNGHFETDCEKLNDYLFYLSFENSNCDDYLTEKLWWNAYHKNSIPVIMGSSRSNLEKLLPYQSYISVEEFANPRDLAAFLMYLNNTPSELAAYFAWKSKFEIRNEHGYFKSKSFHYCRVCEALNYNSRKFKTYNDLGSFWSTKSCYPAWDL